MFSKDTSRLLYPLSFLALSHLLLSKNVLFSSFSFEFSLISSLLLYFTITTWSSFSWSSLQEMLPWTRFHEGRLIRQVLTFALFELFIGLVLSLFHPTCDYLQGLIYFALLPIPTAIFAYASSVWGRKNGISLGGILFRAFLPGILFGILNLIDLWRGPAVFFFHPALGYFPGPLYDEWIPLGANVWTFRVWTIFLSLSLIWASSSKIPVKKRGKLLGCLVLAVFLFRDSWGWHHGEAVIEEALNTSRSLGRIELVYEEGQRERGHIGALLHSLDFRAREAEMILGFKDGKKRKPWKVYLYSNAEQKKRLMGAGHTQLAHPIHRSLHITVDDPMSDLLTHELAHLIMGEFGIPGLRLNLSPAIVEGFAGAIEYQSSGLSMHEWSRAMIRLEKLPDMRKIFGQAGFFGEVSSHAYLSAGSFFRFLLETKGPIRLQKIYRGHSFKKVYGKSLDKLLLTWKKFLREKPLSDEVLERAKPLLNQRSIFQRRCPHDVARWLYLGRKCSPKDCRRSYLERAYSAAEKNLGTIRRLARLEKLESNWTSYEGLAEEIQNLSGNSDFWKMISERMIFDSELLKGESIPELPEASPHLSFSSRLPTLARRELAEEENLSLLRKLVLNGAIDLDEAKALPEGSENRYLFLLQRAQARDVKALREFLPGISEKEKKEKGEVQFLLGQAFEIRGKPHTAMMHYGRFYYWTKLQGLKEHAARQVRRIRDLLQLTR